MKSKPILLHILLWCEMIISARILVFTLPVIVSKYASGNSYFAGPDDWTVLTVTIICLYYFLTGLASIMEIRGWRWFHYLGSVLTAVLTFALVYKVARVSNNVSFCYLIPLFVSVVLSLSVLFIKERKNPS